MTLKERIISEVERRDKRQRERDELNMGAWHSGYYHKFFEGYTEYYEKNARGKNVIKRVYTGVYYRACLGTLQYILLKLIYVLLWCGAFACFMYTTLRNSPVNTNRFTAIPQILTAPMLVWMLTSLMQYVSAPEKMQIGRYKCSSPALIKSAKFAGIGLALCAVVAAAMPMISGGWNTSDLLSALMLGASSLLIFTVVLLESRVRYETILNETSIPDGGFEIN